ncbi:hypothetical protein UAY_01474 [Enterococcus moraviensis ATCC BAA-383]|uniref:Lipoprotein n=1 Tax=Enterococcus moraviensis ATCC BAA-383 TaxID=1158609 RepID=R2QY92_9ENTE|nr:DUF6612 family protein [Enterococcus moraviensis]EOI00371.1 hypothetical protein UAY_01474 [Enterococcus moraviensis ATCC BAA-383]EOT73400.1 hypothetical protein I586_00393 [Enterococcus moraviensis ATCC BAA-383]OJG68959.1 hypothetical protein RV09_GL000358 [Enterococcus moraviensis]
MKKIVLVFALLITLAGCNKTLTKETALKRMEAQENKIDSYELDMDLSVKVSALGQNNNSSVELSTEVDRKNNRYRSDVINADGEELEVIIKDGKAYLEDRPGVWKKTAKVDAKEFSRQADYSVPLEVLGLVTEDLNFETTDDGYYFTYEGYDKKLYKTLKKYYNISFTGFDTTEDLTIKMDINVDKKSLRVQETMIKVIGKNEKGKVSINIDSQYDQFNSIEKIELPEED